MAEAFLLEWLHGNSKKFDSLTEAKNDCGQFLSVLERKKGRIGEAAKKAQQILVHGAFDEQLREILDDPNFTEVVPIQCPPPPHDPPSLSSVTESVSSSEASSGSVTAHALKTIPSSSTLGSLTSSMATSHTSLPLASLGALTSSSPPLPSIPPPCGCTMGTSSPLPSTPHLCSIATEISLSSPSTPQSPGISTATAPLFSAEKVSTYSLSPSSTSRGKKPRRVSSATSKSLDHFHNARVLKRYAETGKNLRDKKGRIQALNPRRPEDNELCGVMVDGFQMFGEGLFRMADSMEHFVGLWESNMQKREVQERERKTLRARFWNLVNGIAEASIRVAFQRMLFGAKSG